MNFDDAFTRLVDPEHEDGYVNDPEDPGGETKYGISKRAYPDEDIAGLTLDRAKFLYQRDFWGPAGCEQLPDLVRYELFDAAVNTSAPGRPVTAVKMLQRAAGLTGGAVDGLFGPGTLAAAQAVDPRVLLEHLWAQRLRYYAGLRPDLRDRYLAGWVNRVATDMLEA
jgi:lysozyme family protein